MSAASDITNAEAIFYVEIHQIGHVRSVSLDVLQPQRVFPNQDAHQIVC
jgi:hypothetical protein